MNEQEWELLLSRVSQDTAGIIHSQRVLNEIDMELRARRTVEEDYIFRAAFGRDAGEPRVIDIDGVDISIRTLHRRGLKQTDVKGADLLYEIAGVKFVLVQYKSPDRRGRVSNDSSQLDEIIKACPHPCPTLGGATFNCGSWYSIQSETESLYMPACRAEKVFGGAKSRRLDAFSQGLPKEAFHSLFGRCWTGAHLSPFDMAGFTWSSLVGDRVLFSVIQAGSFGRW